MLAQALKLPRESGGIYAWTLDEIRAARDLQLAGRFRQPARLAMSQKTDDGAYTALRNRLAPIQGIPTTLLPAGNGARAAKIADEALGLFGPDGVGCSMGTLLDVAESIADHGIGITYNVLTPRADGSRIDLEVRHWPLEHVEWDPFQRCLITWLDDGQRVPIVHGDGRWSVYSHHTEKPWRWGAIVSTALIWADRAYGIRDRSRASTSHGNAKMIGELPEGIAIDSEEGAAMLMLLRTMHEALPYGIRPHGAKTEMLVNTSTSWQIFDSIISNRLKDVARVYLGHDGSISSTGGNYVKDGFLFGVSTSIVEADLRCLERGLYEGAIQVWTALNFGDSSLAPRKIWQMPDADVSTLREELATNTQAFIAAIEGYRSAGFVVDQGAADALAERFGVAPMPIKPAATAASPNVPANASPAAPQAPSLLRSV
jgi:hypothetical protein